MELPVNLAYIGAAVGCVTLISGGYLVLTKAGYVISESQAQEIAQQTVAQEAVSRERGYLELQRELKFNRLRVLNAQAERSADEELEMSVLREDIQRIMERLEELK